MTGTVRCDCDKCFRKRVSQRTRRRHYRSREEDGERDGDGRDRDGERNERNVRYRVGDPTDGPLPRFEEFMDDDDDYDDRDPFKEVLEGMGPLYEGSPICLLMALSILGQWRVDNGVTQTSFESLLAIVALLLPDTNILPKSYYAYEKILSAHAKLEVYTKDACIQASNVLNACLFLVLLVSYVSRDRTVCSSSVSTRMPPYAQSAKSRALIFVAKHVKCSVTLTLLNFYAVCIHSPI